jgi:hypothetical protein
MVRLRLIEFNFSSAAKYELIQPCHFFVGDKHLKIFDQSWNALVLFALSSLIVAACSGCEDPSTPSEPKKSPATTSKSNPTVFKKAIDRAKGLEKEINDRATDPGEKARLGGDDPTLRPPDQQPNDGG